MWICPIFKNKVHVNIMLNSICGYVVNNMLISTHKKVQLASESISIIIIVAPKNYTFSKNRFISKVHTINELAIKGLL